MSESIDVVVVGAGLAGMAAATELRKVGRDVLVLEASDGPGGRVRTDVVDGHRLDRGFQILLAAYPEAQRLLDYDALDLRSFLPGASVRVGDGFHRLSDPLRRPADLLSTVRAPVGKITDKARVLAFRSAVRKGTLAELWARPETSAAERLAAAGFSPQMVEQFFQPLFAGITLDPKLGGSSRVLEFVFRMLSAGDAVVPANGMGAISEQMRAGLGDTVHLQAPVAGLDGLTVQLEDGSSVSAGALIVATGMSAAATLIDMEERSWNGVTSLWFGTDEAPVAEPVIVLNGTGAGAVNNLAVMSNVASSYAPAGRHTVVVSAPSTDPAVADAMRMQLRDWFGSVVDTWTPLRTDVIQRAQPAQDVGLPDRVATVGNGIFAAGDYLTDPSINGALASGSRAALAAKDWLAQSQPVS